MFYKNEQMMFGFFGINFKKVSNSSSCTMFHLISENLNEKINDKYCANTASNFTLAKHKILSTQKKNVPQMLFVWV